MKVALCAIAKNEHHYIEEWVNHYILLGFDHIYIYDNNIDETRSFRAILSKYDKVTLIPCYNKLRYQKQAYYEFYKKYQKEYDYIAYFDIDEFLILHKAKDIHEYLSNPLFENFDSICINYQTYGDSGLTKVENNNYSCLLRFTLLAKKESWKYKNTGYKKIVSTKVNVTMPFNHVHHISPLFCNQCNNRGISVEVYHNDDVNNSFLKNCNIEDALLNHYCTKTLEEYKEKIDRGGGVSGKNGYNLNEYYAVNGKPQNNNMQSENKANNTTPFYAGYK